MDAQLSKEVALAVYGCCRQAERSLDFALGSVPQWQGLLRYYDDEQRHAVQSISEKLEQPGVSATVPTRQQVERRGLLPLLLRPFRRLMKMWRSTWHFPDEEVAFLRGTLERLLNILNQDEPPPTTEVIDLRMDLHAGETLIERRLAGVGELTKARQIEHYCQAPHLRGVRLHELSSAAA